MSIHQTPAGTWRVRYRENGKLRSATVRTKKAAERLDAEYKERRAEGRPIHLRQSAPTLEEFAATWVASKTDVSARTLSGYVRALNKHVIPHLGDLRVHGTDLRPRTLAEWQQNRLDQGAGAAAIREARKALLQILDAAVMPYELLEANPLTPVKPPRITRSHHRWLTADEVERLRRHLIDADDIGSAALVSVLAYVGIRPQDALALEWEHVGKELTVIQKNVDGQIVLGSKTGQAYRRRVYLPDPVRADLESWRVEQRSPTTGLLFPRAKDGKPWKQHDYQNWRNRTVKPAADITGLGALNPYDLRHTAASLLAAAGWNHLEVAAQLGHSPETSVRVYQHLIRVGHGERKPIDDWITEARLTAAKEAAEVSRVP